MSVEMITQDGRERVVMDADEYEDLVDARDAALALREIDSGGTMLSSDEVAAFIASPSPLAFWRKRAGKTQQQLATEAGLSHAFLAQIEGGRREGGVKVLARIARTLGVRLDDLVDAA